MQKRALAFLAAALCASSAQARVSWSTPGSYRLDTRLLNADFLDQDKTFYGMHRLRIDPRIEVGPFLVRLEIDVLTGQFFGDTDSTGQSFVPGWRGNPERSYDGWTTVEPRLGWVELEFGWMHFIAGQVAAQYGLGLVDGDGFDHDEDLRLFERFGHRQAGDLMQRVAFTLRPFQRSEIGPISELAFTLGGDHIYQDDQAIWMDDDSSWRAFGAIQFEGEEGKLGLNVTYRYTDDHVGDEHKTLTTDFYARWDHPLFMLGAELHLETEFAYVHGTSMRYLAPGVTPVDVDAFGGVGRAEISWLCPRVSLGFEVGYASGDDNPNDKKLTSFRFDDDHRAGFILFQDVMRLKTLRSADDVRLARGDDFSSDDQFRLGRTYTDGAIENALYFFPGVTWRPSHWTLTLAGLLAWSATDLIDHAGAILGKESYIENPGRFYGFEVLGSIHYAFPVPAIKTLSVGAQGGIFRAGSALSNNGDLAGKAVLDLFIDW